MTEGEEPIGSMAEEAAKLFAALSDAGRSLGDSIGHGSECRYCPVCQVINLARDASPEVKEHLAAASVSLLAAIQEIFAPVQTGEQEEGE